MNECARLDDEAACVVTILDSDFFASPLCWSCSIIIIIIIVMRFQQNNDKLMMVFLTNRHLSWSLQ